MQACNPVSEPAENLKLVKLDPLNPEAVPAKQHAEQAARGSLYQAIIRLDYMVPGHHPA